MNPITTDDELYELIALWYGQGIVTDENLARLKDRYLLDLGASTCTSCPDWKQDMLDHFLRYLKSINRKVMSQTNNKRQIKAEIGSFYSAANSTIYSNGPTKSTGVTPITDEIVDALIKSDEGYAEYFEENPNYVAPEKAEAKKKDEDKK